MKIFFIISLLTISVSLSAQTPGEQLAKKVAQKMKDSLSLTEQQHNQIYTINIQLHQQKQEVFEKQTEAEARRSQIQRIENTRDTLYSAVLPADKYLLYKQKKLNLVYRN